MHLIHKNTYKNVALAETNIELQHPSLVAFFDVRSGNGAVLKARHGMTFNLTLYFRFESYFSIFWIKNCLEN